MEEKPDSALRQDISSLVAETAEQLITVDAGNPRFEAELMLADALGKPRVYLFTHSDEIPDNPAMLKFLALVKRRLAFEPLQYVLGTAQFRDLLLRVGPGVLIPRSETEGLVDIAWGALERRRHLFEERGEVEKPYLIDVGVGSGAILLSLIYEDLRRLGSIKVVGAETWFRSLGLDISPTPLSYTADNAVFCQLPSPELKQSDFLSVIDPELPVAGIVSNPPYVSVSEMAALPVEINEFEPHEALFGGEDGMTAIRILLDQVEPFLKRGVFFCFEIGGNQEALVRGELVRRDLFDIATISADLAGRPRVVLIEPGRIE